MSKRRRQQQQQPEPEAHAQDAEPQIATSSNSATASAENGGTRRRAMRQVAESRAAHFARADENESLATQRRRLSSSAASSTPMPSHRSSRRASQPNGNDQPEERWPGPFATGYQIMQDRERALQERQERIEAAAQGEAKLVKQYLDEYERMAAEEKWVPKGRGKGQKGVAVIPSLHEVALKVIVAHIDAVESLGEVAPEVRKSIAAHLARRRMLNNATIKVVIDRGLSELDIPDCSAIEEDCLIEMIERAVSPIGEELIGVGADQYLHMSSQHSLQVIRLLNCGKCFGDRTAAAILNHLANVSVLAITGAYRLSDGALEKLLNAVPRLRALDLSTDSRLHHAGIASISKLPQLRSLVVDYCVQLTDEDLKPLLQCPSLEELSLGYLEQLSTEFLVELIQAIGQNLRSLSLAACDAATDEVVVAIRSHCRYLQRLNLRDLNLTTECLLGLFISAPDHVDAMDSAHGASVGALESVNLRSTSGVTDDVIVQLVSGSSGAIRELDLHSAHLLTDRSLMAIGTHCWESLVTLDLSYVRGITDNALGWLVDRCKVLKELRVYGCSQLTDQFIHGYSNLSVQLRGR